MSIMPYDLITTIDNSIVQHGKFNDRIYLMKLSEKDFPNIIYSLEDMAISKKYTKIFAKVPEYARDEFLSNNYVEEARIPKFYGNDDVCFVSKFFDTERKSDNRIDKINKILDMVKNKNYKQLSDKNDKNNSCQHQFEYGICDESHANTMADIYKKVFKTYPFPIFDPEYIKKTMKENFIYFFVKETNKIVALSSSEMDIDSKTVEMTDFATLSEYQRKGLAYCLLDMMENNMVNKNIKIAYTISRSLSYGINMIFAKMGYNYGGLLVNNTNICGNFESMNVWYRHL